MQFKEVLYSTEIASILSKIKGVKAVNDVIFTQDRDFTTPGQEGVFKNILYSKSININGEVTIVNDRGYGFYYDFKQFFNYSAPQGRGVVLPSVDPSIFEIKDMNTDIKGVVR